MSYIYVAIAVVLLAFEFACSKKYQALEGTQMVPGLRFNALTGLLSALTMLVISGFQPAWSPLSLILAIGQAACCIAYSLIGFRVLKMGGMALYSTFLMSGGMLLPYIFGLLFLDEQPSVLRIIGVLVVLAGVVCTNASEDKVSKGLLFLCAAVFALNGGVSIISKCHQVSTRPTVSTSAFVMYAGVAKCLISALVLPFTGKSASQRGFAKKHSLPIIAGGAIIGAASYFLQLIGAANLPASVLYPMVTGGSIIFSAIAGVIIFKEQLSRRQIISITLCFIGTLLFL